MLQRLITIVALSSVLLAYSSNVRAEMVLTLSSPDDLTNLLVDQTVTIQVSLTGLESAQELESLSGTVEFAEAVFGLPSTPVAGDIITDAADFTPFADPGLADGLFFTTEAANRITSDGVFYSFDLTVVGAGSGTFSFQSGSLSAEIAGQQDPLFPTAGDSLAYTVVIPEPASAALLGIVGVILFAGRRRR